MSISPIPTIPTISNNTLRSVESLRDPSSKGILYKIKGATDTKTIGYLFGTVHGVMVPVPAYLNLDDKVIKYLGKSSHLHLEVSPCLETMETLRAMSVEELLQCSADVDFQNLVSSGESLSVEHMLIKIATETSKPIEGIETEESRKHCDGGLSEEIKEVRIKRHATEVYFTHSVLTMMEEMEEMEEMEKMIEECEKVEKDLELGSREKVSLDALYKKLLNISTLAFEVVKFHDFTSTGFSAFAEESTLRAIVNWISDISHALGVPELDIIKETFKAKEEYEEKKRKEISDSIKRVILSWVKGDIKEMADQEKLSIVNDELKAKGNVFEEKLVDLSIRQRICRHSFMADVIHQSLLQSSPENRRFYAIGAAHLFENFNDVARILKSRGWKLVDAYQIP